MLDIVESSKPLDNLRPVELHNPLPIRLHRVEVRQDASQSLLRTKSVKRNRNRTTVVAVNTLLVWLLKKPVEDIDQLIAKTIGIYVPVKRRQKTAPLGAVFGALSTAP